jgi:hypothetical protein
LQNYFIAVRFNNVGVRFLRIATAPKQVLYEQINNKIHNIQNCAAVGADGVCK